MTHAAHRTKLMSCPAPANCISFFEKLQSGCKGPWFILGMWSHPVAASTGPAGNSRQDPRKRGLPELCKPCALLWPGPLLLPVTCPYTLVSYELMFHKRSSALQAPVPLPSHGPSRLTHSHASSPGVPLCESSLPAPTPQVALPLLASCPHCLHIYTHLSQ